MHFDCAGSDKTVVAAVAADIFPVNFHAKLLLWHVHAFRLRKLAENGVPGGVPDHFPHQFPHKMALTTCPCAFRLRGLAQNQTSHIETLRRQSLYRDLAKWPLMEILFRDIAYRPLTKILPWDPLQRSSVEISYRKSLAKNLLQSSCTEILPGHLCCQGLPQTCSETLRRDLLQRSCQEVSCINFAKGGFREFVQKSEKEILPRDLWYVCQASSSRDLCRDKALIESCTQILPGDNWWRSCTETWWKNPCVHSAEKLCPLNRLQTQPYTTKWCLNLNQPPLLQNALGVFVVDQKPMSVTTKWLYETIL